ncbi:NAD(P)/FAD-dependent oxidoreductase [bacterium]|nr:NAD(P)/FAD-dependent oxidoreductase [candidate division CSSED10-310 bacterium]
MTQKHFVIIGNGAAGNRAADVLREGDSHAKITIISDEFFHFYYRHRLKDFIVGNIDETSLTVRSSEYYHDKHIRLRLGQQVIKIDLNSQLLYLKHMELVRYTHLLLCTGGKPRMPEIHYRYREHFTSMITLDDAKHMKQQLPAVKRMIVVGGDLISVQITKRLLNAGIEVVFLVDRDAFWPLTFSDVIEKDFNRALRRAGAKIISDDAIVNIEKLGHMAYQVRTRSGENLECNLVGGFFGLVPQVDFLVGSGLDIDRGILVDEHLKTHFDNVYAAGDCAQVYNPQLSNYWVSIGWGNAVKLGEIAAHNMLGSPDTAIRPPINVLDYEGIEVKTEWWQEVS